VGHGSKRVAARQPFSRPTAIGGGLALAALGMALSVVVLARHDLARMRKGQVDPRGEGDTREALQFSRVVAAMSCGTLLVWLLLLGAEAQPRQRKAAPAPAAPTPAAPPGQGQPDKVQDNGAGKPSEEKGKQKGG
jgi:hypothetical protein